LVGWREKVGGEAQGPNQSLTETNCEPPSIRWSEGREVTFIKVNGGKTGVGQERGEPTGGKPGKRSKNPRWSVKKPPLSVEKVGVRKEHQKYRRTEGGGKRTLAWGPCPTPTILSPVASDLGGGFPVAEYLIMCSIKGGGGCARSA